MNQPSPLTTALFILLVAIVVTLVVRAILGAGRPGRRRRNGTATLWATGLLVVYLLIPAVLAWARMLDRYDPLPAPALLMVGALTVLTIALGVSPAGATLAGSVGTAALIGVQVFRIPVEWLLHRLFLEGVIPVQMTYAGRNFDIASGLTAAAIALALARRRRIPRAWLLAWNLAALGLLVNIMAIALLATPAPFRQFVDGPPNRLPSTFPYVWLPTWLVQAALAGHVLLFRALRIAAPAVSPAPARPPATAAPG